MRKQIVIFFHAGEGNQDIIDTEYKQFYKKLKNEAKLADPDLGVKAIACPTAEWLLREIRELTAQANGVDEFYFHFSGHGQEKGIPYNDWLVSNEDFADIIEHPKVKCCYFSSCQSAELVELVNRNKVPIVVGTAGANDIGNQFAIDFQLEFYIGLLQRRSFESAFTQAKALTNELYGKDLTADSFTRGEGAFTRIKKEQINALQIVFDSEKERDAHLLYPTFVDQIRQINDGKPALLVWSDDKVRLSEFEVKFRNLGWEDFLHLVELPENETAKINNRGADDPWQYGNIIFLLLLSRDFRPDDGPVLNDHLRSHLAEGQNWEQQQYRIFCAHRQGLDLARLIDSDTIMNRFGDHNLFHFQQSPDELFDQDRFETSIQEQEVDFISRKQITFGFEVKPSKEEFATVIFGKKAVASYFFADIRNEKLVNFLSNFVKDKAEYEHPPVVLDNQGRPDMDFDAELLRNLQALSGNNQNLALQFSHFFKDGIIMIFRNWHDDIESWKKFIENVISNAWKVIDFMEMKSPERNYNFIFFLSQFDASRIGLNMQLKHEKFSRPIPLKREHLKAWENEFNVMRYNIKIEETVKKVACALNPEEYKDCCPSKAIEFVCEQLRVPPRHIVRI